MKSRVESMMMRKNFVACFFVLMVLVAVTAANAQVAMPKVLASHMVVQRDLPVHVWGMAGAGEAVSVVFRGETGTTTASRVGRWSVYLKPGEAGGPFTLTVTGTPAAGGAEETVALDDVLVGDVWVASGQSNMEFPLRRASTAATDLPNAANSKIRLLIVDKKPADFAQDDIATKGWVESTPETAKDFSAVAWFFAREIEAKEHVPVGVIDSTWGGTPAEAWTRVAALGEDASLNSVFSYWGKMTDGETDAELSQKDEQRQRDEAKAAGTPIPQFPWHPDLLSWGPGMLWNGMIAPLTPMAIRGVIWYQGESNGGAERYPIYDKTMRALIEDWRKQWGVGAFPFLFTQIANYKTGAGDNWANLRDQQLKTLGLGNTGMAVTIDIGNPDDIHPTNKAEVGRRLALWARALAYGEDVSYSGPQFRQATPEGNSIRVWFEHHAKGLVAKGGELAGAQGLVVKEGELTGWEVAGADGKFVPATAKIDGNTVVATSDAVTEPRFVRYGWASSPQCNLFNGEGLPASPFTSQ
jgi:sialate O-acetylesterase